MKEYRIMAYFREDAPRGYQPRSYKRKIVNSLEDATVLYAEAVKYYRNYKYLKNIVIESREVSEWRNYGKE